MLLVHFQLWDSRQPSSPINSFMGHNGPTFAIDWHHEERNWVASAGRDKMIKVHVANRLSVDYWPFFQGVGHQGCVLEAPWCHRQLTLILSLENCQEKVTFSYKLIYCQCWAPRISWLGTFGHLKSCFRPQP